MNLVHTWKTARETAEYSAAPFFRTGVLNRSIIVKHRLRGGEGDVFESPRSVGTKVILPLDITNLRAGARSFMVDQIGFVEMVEELSGENRAALTHDLSVLKALDRLPSLDPFLSREILRRQGISPARCYFNVTPADLGRIAQFATQEVASLLGMSIDRASPGFAEKATRLADMLLSNEVSSEFEPLRGALSMDSAAFSEGMFCWKGFIYYKWLLTELAPRVSPVATEIANTRAMGPQDPEVSAYLNRARANISRALVKACATVRQTLSVYDAAYADLTQNSQPLAFRRFLLEAPSLFSEIGERLGAVEHIVSFWRFRFPPDKPRLATQEELQDLFLDFESGIAAEADKAAAR